MLPGVTLTSGGSSSRPSSAAAPAAIAQPPVAGEPGKPGPPGKPGRDGSGFRFLGPWIKNYPYKVNDVVAFQGSSYIALVDNIGRFPTTKVVWGVLAARGTSNGGGGGGGGTGPKGDKGDKGDTGDPGVPGLVWLGAYDSSTPYVESDAVSYLGSSYICIAPTTGNDPTNGAFWQILAAKGADGGGGGGGGYDPDGVTIILNDDGKLAVADPTVINETPGGSLDGSNADFALSNPPIAGSTLVSVMGLLMVEGTDYNVLGSVITFVPEQVPQSGEWIRVTYQT